MAVDGPWNTPGSKKQPEPTSNQREGMLSEEARAERDRLDSFRKGELLDLPIALKVADNYSLADGMLKYRAVQVLAAAVRAARIHTAGSAPETSREPHPDCAAPVTDARLNEILVSFVSALQQSAPKEHNIDMDWNEGLSILREVIAGRSAPETSRRPDGYAYRYESRAGGGLTYLSFDREAGRTPTEVIPYFFGAPYLPDETECDPINLANIVPAEYRSLARELRQYAADYEPACRTSHMVREAAHIIERLAPSVGSGCNPEPSGPTTPEGSCLPTVGADPAPIVEAARRLDRCIVQFGISQETWEAHAVLRRLLEASAPSHECDHCGEPESAHLGEKLICPDAAIPDVYRFAVKASGNPSISKAEPLV